MREIKIKGKTPSMVIIGSSNKKKVFIWYGMNNNNEFEFGSIIANNQGEAQDILLDNMRGGTFKIKEVNTDKEFSSIATVTKKSNTRTFESMWNEIF